MERLNFVFNLDLLFLLLRIVFFRSSFFIVFASFLCSLAFFPSQLYLFLILLAEL